MRACPCVCVVVCLGLLRRREQDLNSFVKTKWCLFSNLYVFFCYLLRLIVWRFFDVVAVLVNKRTFVCVLLCGVHGMLFMFKSSKIKTVIQSHCS